MSHAAFTIKAFAVYLVALGASLVFVPNLMLSIFGFAPTNEVWIRVLGVVVFNLGWYYWYAAASEARPFFAASVATRVFALLAFSGLVVKGFAPPMLALFGVIDAAGGAWTWAALRRDRRFFH
ncbi:hypothetical protein [Hydrogenophaga sp.]|uniref:hypothetical protein n=1 Tax=Hydrogenophaga sp. TaxID=1904254 RepID=UPI003F6F913A